ncbi:MAG: AAA family ATPase [Acidimicrobiaceae bacterium]|nr:AAA family ATPase [Acidimicrobiaceae bacterium]
MTDSTKRQTILDAERAVNEQYLNEIERLIQRHPQRVRQIAVVQSQRWTTSSPLRLGIDRGATTGVIGRVALQESHPYSDMMDQTFYIAGWYAKKDGFEAVNWTAPIASLFFQGRSSKHEIAPSVTGRRTFVLRGTDLVDYADEVETGVDDPFEGMERSLAIPVAPTRRRHPVQPVQSEKHRSIPESTETEEQPYISTTELHETESTSEVNARRRGLRAVEAVVKVMKLPKRGRMGAVLPTMQSDQYQLVTAAGDRGLVLQGQPGTGKTVVAVHRAVYLTSAERETERVGRVAIVGPSDHYVDHVKPIISELKEPEAEIQVLSLPGLLKKVAGLPLKSKPGDIGRIESSWELGREIDSFVRKMPDRPVSAPMDQRVRRVVEAMQRADSSEIGDSELLTWLRGLPSWNALSGETRYLPMLATVALALDSSEIGNRVGHLIVDEAQDVRPLEWRILTTSLLEDDGSLSLFGDMNQRRSDWTAATWEQLAEDLDITDEAGHCDIRELQPGYRSTRQILRFANQLLPRGERAEQALRDGPQPSVEKVSGPERTTRTVDVAIDLTRRNPGMVAIITTKPRAPSVVFRDRGWKRGDWLHSWTRSGTTVVILHPDEARGLEFDAVVVVEPGDFPENVGRQGVLYTSLTRANNELAVIHSKRLPRGLRLPR